VRFSVASCRERNKDCSVASSPHPCTAGLHCLWADLEPKVKRPFSRTEGGKGFHVQVGWCR
jgi:hypothetical protein